MKKKNILYLLGSGRSGTTLLATILNSTNDITTSGEVHQFYTYLQNKSTCSCGDVVCECDFWSDVITDLNVSEDEIHTFQKKQNNEEGHRYILSILLGRKASADYIASQERLFTAISNHTNKNWILDSSKYIGRFLLLNQIPSLKVKGIYVVRDVRGVINSFNKQVQTPKKPINTIFYYLLTNFFGQLVCWIHKDVIKLKYEDFIDNPHDHTQYIYSKLLDQNNDDVTLNDVFEMPHIIGGNRLKSSKTIKIKKDTAWKTTISRPKQILYYLLCLPFMLLNRYKL
ncbi:MULTISPECIES: sulfotransferase [Bizionia]|uniref:sulfotransferase n=1 Tax=Bizionia TaxID=283785 RepID=UPI0008051018|nr:MULTISPECIES: sulfotransferase [Bizionia]OBX21649.1 hypothetical protein BAA08_11690 [Bizionia sp. APA-3]